MDELNPQFSFHPGFYLFICGENIVPQDLPKRHYGEELWSYSLKFIEIMYSALNGETVKELGKKKNRLC